MTVEGARRLGKRELGPHAFEVHMPTRVASLIEKESSINKLYHVVPHLAHLLEQDVHLEVAYLCNDNVVQVYKITGEGSHFCAYRNLQMIIPSISTIPELQQMIEEAWDAGHNAYGRVETGGIRGTRKHIGASEVEALLMHLDIPCTGHRLTGGAAWTELLDLVEKYFSSSTTTTSCDRVVRTRLRPIFLQRPQHSLTIVGIEKDRHGKRQLLVFDPAYRPPVSLRHPQYISSRFQTTRIVLSNYRRGKLYLKRYKQFEIVQVDQILPSPANEANRELAPLDLEDRTVR